MANALYTLTKNKLLTTGINFGTDTIKIAFVNNTYPQNLATDEFLTSISAYIVGTPQTLTSKVVADGTFDAADPAWTALAAGSTIEAAVIYKDTGTAGTSPLLLYLDTITGIPFATNGGGATLQFDNSGYKIFGL